MNNYCTNCGNKLKENDLMCNKCKEAVVDLKKDYLMRKGSSISLSFILIIFVFVIYALFLAFKYFN